MNTFTRAASKLAAALAVGLALMTAGITVASAQTGTPHLMLQLKDGTVDI